MFFVQCPFCGDPIEIPDEAVAEEGTDASNFVDCHRCELTFAYDEVEVHMLT